MAGAAWWVELDAVAPFAGHAGAAVREPTAEPLRRDTPFDLASLTKPLATAPLVLMLADDGRLDPDAPIAEVLAELHGSPWGDATPLELARHCSGLPAWRPLCAAAGDLAGYVERIAAEPPAVPRGTTLYSDLGYVLLGAIVERLAGEPLDRVFVRRIAGPAGVAGRVRFPRDPWPGAAATEDGNRYERAMAGEAGADHAWREGPIRGVVHDANAAALGGVAGHAGLFGTLEATARLVRELRSGTHVRLRETARRLWSRPERDGRRSVGLQAADDSAAARGVLPDDAPGHTGFTGTSLWLDPCGPERGGFCLLLTNRIHPRVPAASFQPVRRAFHRLVARAARGRYDDA